MNCDGWRDAAARGGAGAARDLSSTNAELEGGSRTSFAIFSDVGQEIRKGYGRDGREIRVAKSANAKVGGW